MGNFYVNITLRGPKQEEIGTALKALGRTAIVSPSKNDFTTVYDAECDEQDTGAISAFTKELSFRLSCPGWSVMNHDDDILLYELYDKGELIDQYNSSPDYFSMEADDPSGPKGGNADALVRLMGNSGDAAEAENIIRISSFDEDGFVFAVERHQALADCLGLPSFTVGYGYNYVSGGEMPPEFEETDFLEVR